MKNSFVYILTNKTDSTLYIGVTGDIERRIYEHKNKLVYFEEYYDITDAIKREKQLKNWRRDWKIELIKSFNPDFKDLADPESSSG